MPEYSGIMVSALFYLHSDLGSNYSSSRMHLFLTNVALVGTMDERIMRVPLTGYASIIVITIITLWLTQPQVNNYQHFLQIAWAGNTVRVGTGHIRSL